MTVSGACVIEVMDGGDRMGVVISFERQEAAVEEVGVVTAKFRA